MLLPLLLFLTPNSSLLTPDFVVADTAYTAPSGYVANRADSVKVNGHTFVGPGPLKITFRAEMSQQPDYCSWELASDNQFEEIIDQLRVLGPDGVTSQLDYDFDESGTYYVRFVADFNSYLTPTELGEGATATYQTSVPYQIQITESLLEVPNLITPDSPDSRNSVFHVRYKSLVSYEIWIVNRWGQELYHSTNPEDGWDGRFNGSTVPTGAYYYLIKAEGTDGISYNKKGSLNVLRTRDSQKR